MDGQGVPQNYILARMPPTCGIANVRFPDSAPDGALKAPDLAACEMTPPQIAEAKKLAGEWKPKPKPKQSYGLT